MTLAANVREATDPEGGGEQTLMPGQILGREIVRTTKQFAIALRGDTAAAERLARDGLTAIRQVRDLYKCEPTSVLGALMTAAQLNLRPGVLGECYILPFWSTREGIHQAQFVIGYKGLATLAHRTGLVRSLVARTVYAKERPAFSLTYHEDRDELRHTPWLGPDKGPAELFYSRGLLANGGYQLTRPSTVTEMIEYRETHAKRDRQGNIVGPWITHFEQMIWKTHVKWVCNLLPKSVDLAVGLDADGTVRRDTNPHADPLAVVERADERTVDGEVRPEPATQPAAGDEHPGRRADERTDPREGRHG